MRGTKRRTVKHRIERRHDIHKARAEALAEQQHAELEKDYAEAIAAPVTKIASFFLHLMY